MKRHLALAACYGAFFGCCVVLSCERRDLEAIQQSARQIEALDKLTAGMELPPEPLCPTYDTSEPG